MFYFVYEGYDVNRIFCKYRDKKGLVYAYVSSPEPRKYSILHFLQHALDRYKERLKLHLKNTDEILYHMSKYGLTMVRQEVGKRNEDLLNVLWVGNNGLWLGESGSTWTDANTHPNLVRTFIDLSLKRDDQEAIMDDETLDRLIAFEQSLGGDDYARKMIGQLIDLFMRQ